MLELKRIKIDAEAARSFLESGGKWKKLLFFTPRELKTSTYLKTAVLINGAFVSSGMLDGREAIPLLQHMARALVAASCA